MAYSFRDLEGKYYAILVDLDRCVECHACEVACKLENKVPPHERWIEVITVGPVKLSEKMHALYFPIMSDKCHLCNHRIKNGLEPFCVSECPTKALVFCDSEELIRLLKSEKRYIIAKVKRISESS